MGEPLYVALFELPGFSVGHQGSTLESVCKYYYNQTNSVEVTFTIKNLFLQIKNVKL